MTERVVEQDPLQAPALCALKIFLREGQPAPAKTLWQRVFARSLAASLVEEAKTHGLVCGAVTRGNVGFGPGANTVVADWMVDGPIDQLPVCVELVGTREQLESFIALQGSALKDAALVLYEGSGIRLRPLEKVAS